jgi:hypothetical protein
MRLKLFWSAGVIGLVAAAALFWFLKNPQGEVIPAEFRGTWLDQGAECNDTSAQARITGSTINYDQLAFKADGLADRRNDVVLLSGASFPKGNMERTTVQLAMQDHRTKLIISASNLPRGAALVRCSGSDSQ